MANNTVSIIDNINNKTVAKTQLLKTQDNIWVLKNIEGKLSPLLDITRTYKLTVESQADATFVITPLKFTRDFVVVKILPIKGGRERRRYLRIPCNIKTNIVVRNEVIKGKILELSYGSMVINIDETLDTNENIIVHLKEIDGESAFNCSMYVVKENKNAEDELWADGTSYVVLIDIDRTDEKAMELLYAKLCRMQHEMNIV